MTARRLRAPAIDGGVLVEPPAERGRRSDRGQSSSVGRLGLRFPGPKGRLAARRGPPGSRCGWRGSFLERHGLSGTESRARRRERSRAPAGRDRASARAVPSRASGSRTSPRRRSPARIGGVGLNLIVDNDIPKSSSIAVPAIDEGGFGSTRVEFDRWGGDAPFEDSPVLDEERFATFADRVRAVLGDAVADPLLDDFWPRVLERRAEAATHGMRFSLARRELEASWGVANLEVPLSDGLPDRRVLLVRRRTCWPSCPDTGRSTTTRSTSIARRMGSGARTTRSPRSRDRESGSRRRSGSGAADSRGAAALLVRQRCARDGPADRRRRRGLDRAAPGAGPRGVLRRRAAARAAGRSVRLRTRALTTTMFSRFLLGDLFIHGIGGAKYDELGDEIARRFFGIEPPGFLTVSMTLWLGLPSDPATPADLAAVERRLARPPIQSRPPFVRTVHRGNT